MRCIQAEKLRALSTRIFTSAGWPEQDARETAEHLVLANLSGHDSHGIAMITVYIGAYEAGLLKPSNRPQTKIDNAPFLVIDAHVALGQKTANDATRRAIAMTKTSGVCILNVINSHHMGRIGHYAEMAAAEGLVGLFWVNVAGRIPIVAAHGAKQARFGTNPHTIGIPDGENPLILDFATSRMAHGKARIALNKAEPVPEGYLITNEGLPTTDPQVVFPDGRGTPLGALLPFGDHKGAGIALMVEILSAGLSDGATITHTEAKSWVINSMFAIFLDPARLEPDETSRSARIRALADYMRAAAPQPGIDRVRAPGDKERETRLLRQREGIPVDDGTWKLLAEAAAKVGVDAEQAIA